MMIKLFKKSKKESFAKVEQLGVNELKHVVGGDGGDGSTDRTKGFVKAYDKVQVNT